MDYSPLHDATLDTEYAYLTLLKCSGPINKSFTEDASQPGGYRKKPGPEITEAAAKVVPVFDSLAMLRLQWMLLNNPQLLLISGYFPGVMPGETFLVLSREEMSRRTGIAVNDPHLLGWHTVDYNGKPWRAIARLKSNMVSSCWGLFDRDDVPGMPEHLRYMSEEEFLIALARLLPGFAQAPLIAVPSASARVTVDGQIISPHNAHYWTRYANAQDQERAMKAMLFRGFELDPELSFMRPLYSRKDGSQLPGNGRPWTIVDPTTASCERLVYDGMPTVRGKRLSVLEAQPRQLRDGLPIDTRALEIPNPRRIKELKGIKVDIRRDAGRVTAVQMIDTLQLQLDTEIETLDHGFMTVAEYWESDLGHIRTQAPFRDSDSWNGYLNRHEDGVPFAYDTGEQCKYLLPRDVVQRYWLEQEFGDSDLPSGPWLDSVEPEPEPEPEPIAPEPATVEPDEQAATIAELLGGDERVSVTLGETGTGKTYAMAVRYVEDIRAGDLPIVMMNSTRGIEQFEAEVIKVSGGLSVDDLGGVIYRRVGGSVRLDDADSDEAEEGAGSAQGGAHLCQARGVVLAYPGYTHRRGDSVEWYALVRQLAALRLRDAADFPEELRDCAAAFKTRKIRIYIDECDAFMFSLLRVVQLDRRVLEGHRRGLLHPVKSTVVKCPAFVRQGKCGDCELHRQAVRGRVDEYHSYELFTAPHPEEPLKRGHTVVLTDQVVAKAARVLGSVEIPEFGFRWTLLESAAGAARIPGPYAYTRKLGFAEYHDPSEILHDLITHSYRPTMIEHMAHTPDRLLSSKTCRAIDEAKHRRDVARKAAADFGDLDAAEFVDIREPPEVKAAREAQTAEDEQLLAWGAEREFPSYGCEVRYLQLADLAPLGWLVHFAEVVRFTGASMPSWGVEMLASAFGQSEIEVSHVRSRDRLLDGVLVIDVHWELKAAQLEQIAAHTIARGDRPLLFFGFSDRVAPFVESHQQLSLATFEHGKTSNGLVAPGLTDLPEQRGLVSYVRSAIGASANLPEYRVTVIDSVVHSPTMSLLMPEEITPDSVLAARSRARNELLRQPAGRTLRLAADWEGPQYRVIIFHNPDVDLETGRALPPPMEVLQGIRNRTEPRGFRLLGVTHSVPYICAAIDEFLASGRVTTLEPAKDQKMKSKQQRERETPAERERRTQEKRAERRAAVLEQLTEEREAGAPWRDARVAAGVKSGLYSWFDSGERRVLKKLYEGGSTLAI